MFHALMTLIFCILVCWIDPGLCFIPAGFYFGREVAQAEERYIKAHGGKRADCPWYCGFLKDAWTEKGMSDWYIPAAISIIFYIVFELGLIQSIFNI